MIIRLTAVVLLLVLLSYQSLAQALETHDAGIRETVWNYVNGRNTGDSVQLKKAFHKDATLSFVDISGALVKWTAADYIKRMSTGRMQDCTGEILEVRSYSDAAQATVVLKYSNAIFYDYLNLLRVQGRWVITDKIFSKKATAQ